MDAIQEKIFNKYKELKTNLAKEILLYRKQKRVGRGSDKQDDFADIIACLDFYYQKQFSERELKEMITDGHKDLSFVDAVVIHENGVDIFDIKTNGSDSNLDAIKNGIDNYFKQVPGDYSTVNPILASALKKIHKKHRKNINLIFLREFNNEKSEENFKGKYDHLTETRNVAVHLFTRSKLIHRRQGTLDLGSLLLENTKLLNKKGEKVNWAITVTSLSDILEQYKKISDKDLLFAKNIRKPLEEKRIKNILSRSLESAAKTFHYRHNGIVMTASSISEDMNRLRIDSPQVLNGAQTLGALFAIYEEDKNLFKDAKIVVKVLSIDNQQDIDDVCEAANTQRPVSTADIRTNDSLQKNLELYIGSIKDCEYFYIRGKINPQKKKAYRKQYTLIDKETFIQWANSAFLGRPYESKNQKTKLFAKTFSNKENEPYKEIEESINDNWDNIEALCKIAVYVDKKIKELPKVQKGYAKIMDQHIIASMYKEYESVKKLSDDILDKNFNKMFKVHISAFRKAAKTKGSSLKMRNYFISPRSF